VRRVDIPVEGLAPDLDGFRIVQISDLHAGPTMRLAYVQRVVDMTKELAPDLIALTGDMVDGSVPRLALHVAPLEALASAGRAGRLRSATVGTHARRPVLPVDVRDSPGPRAARGGALAARPLVGLRQCRHGDVGSARASRHEAGAHAPAPRGRERTDRAPKERNETAPGWRRHDEYNKG